MTDLFTPQERRLQALRLAAIISVEFDKAIYHDNPEALDASERHYRARMAAIDEGFREETRRRLLEYGYSAEEVEEMLREGDGHVV